MSPDDSPTVATASFLTLFSLARPLTAAVPCHPTVIVRRRTNFYMAPDVPLMSSGHDIPIALRAAYLALHRRSDAAFAPHGVTADQFVLLATLARGGEALAQRELAHRMSSDPSTVRAMLVLLEERGLVQRNTDPTDARKRTVTLTAKGERVFRRLWTAGKPIRAQMRGALRPGEAETLDQILRRVAETLNAECAPVGESTSSYSQGIEL